MRYLVLIGDIVESRRSRTRAALQRKLTVALETLNQRGEGVVSPYTLTLGDEFQAVFRSADHVFAEMFGLLGTLHPVGVRFSYAIGTISTRINRQRAVGMDGPAFYAAREGITQLKQQGEICRLAGLGADEQPLASASLRVVGHFVARWKANRYQILRDVLESRRVQDTARDLGISEQAVYKNIASGGLEALAEMFDVLAVTANARLKG